MDWQGLSRELGQRRSLRAVFLCFDRNPQLVEALAQRDGIVPAPQPQPVLEGSAAKSGAFRSGGRVP